METHAVIEVGPMPILNIYSAEMHQLFQNLITNAIKFQKKNTVPKIKISAKNIQGACEFKVSDNGIGVEKNYFEKIFNLFTKLNDSSEYEGSGIGLANCKKIVLLHKGEIWIRSELGKGSDFYFTIPELQNNKQ